MNQLSIAIKIAVEAHDGQFDKAGEPYILHPLKVMHYTKSTDPEILALAVLHDVVEDNKNYTYNKLRDLGVSERIIAGLRLLTKVPGQTEEEYKEGVKSTRDTIIVKMADLRHNSDIRRLRGVTEKDIARTVKYLKFYEELKAL